jgi:predicted XRE-type DNA-binding protein
LFSEEEREDELRGHCIGDEAIQADSEMMERVDMRAKKRRQGEHAIQHVTPAGRSALMDLTSDEDAIELEMRSTLLRGLERWLESSDLTKAEAAKMLGITQARMSDLKRGKISQFSLDMLVRLAARGGLHPVLTLAA